MAQSPRTEVQPWDEGYLDWWNGKLPSRGSREPWNVWAKRATGRRVELNDLPQKQPGESWKAYAFRLAGDFKGTGVVRKYEEAVLMSQTPWKACWTSLTFYGCLDAWMAGVADPWGIHATVETKPEEELELLLEVKRVELNRKADERRWKDMFGGSDAETEALPAIRPVPRPQLQGQRATSNQATPRQTTPREKHLDGRPGRVPQRST